MNLIQIWSPSSCINFMSCSRSVCYYWNEYGKYCERELTTNGRRATLGQIEKQNDQSNSERFNYRKLSTDAERNASDFNFFFHNLLGTKFLTWNMLLSAWHIINGRHKGVKH